MNLNKQTVFITGSVGFLGEALLKKFSPDNYTIKAMVYNDEPIPNNFSGIDFVRADITKKETLNGKLEGVDIVYHLAGVVTDWAPKSLYRDVHVEGTRNLVEEAIKSGVKKFVFISTLFVIDFTQRGIKNENSPLVQTRDWYPGTKRVAEEMLLSYHKKGLIDVAIIRPSWIYGYNDSTFIPEIVYQTRKKMMMIIGNPENHIPFVHVDNLAGLIKEAGTATLKKENIFIAVDGHLTWKDLTDKISNSVHMNRKIPCLPYFLAYILAYVMETWARVRHVKKRPLLTVSSVSMLGKDIMLDGSLAKEILHYEPAVEFQSGISEVISAIVKKPEAELRKK